MKKGFFAAFLCALIMVLLPAAVYAMDGTGTEDNPYQISSAADLEEFRDRVNDENGKTRNSSACAILKNDIVLNNDVLNSDGSLNEEKASTFEEWTPIGTASNPYTGTFDGTGHTVSGIYINTSEDYQGLFGYIGIGGTVKDLGIEKSRIKGGNNVGGIAGYSIGSIEDCYNTGSVSGGNNVGGIAGTAYSAKDCHNEGTVSGSDCVGGILGSGADLNGVVNRCYNTGDISGEGGVGGIAGRNILGVTNSYNTGTISGEYASGIAGGSRMGVVNCYNIGKVGYNAISGAHDMEESANNYYLKGCTSEENDEGEQTA